MTRALRPSQRGDQALGQKRLGARLPRRLPARLLGRGLDGREKRSGRLCVAPVVVRTAIPVRDDLFGRSTGLALEPGRRLDEGLRHVVETRTVLRTTLGAVAIAPLKLRPRIGVQEEVLSEF